MKARDFIDFNPKMRVEKRNDVPFIEMAALPSGQRYIPEIAMREAVSSGSKFQDGDTLFARITPCLENGKGGFVTGLGEGVVGQGSTEFIVFRAKDPMDRDFVYYLSRFPAFRRFAEKGMAGTSGRQRVAWQTLADFELPDLSPAYRRACGEILTALDKKIELNRQMNKALEATARAVYRDWFVDFGPTRRKAKGETDSVAILGGLFDDPTRASSYAALFPDRLSGNGLPVGWAKRELGGLCNIVGGGTPSTKEPAFWDNGSHLWATPKDLSKLSGLFLRETERRVTDVGLKKVSSGLCPKGSILMSSRAPIGYVAIAEEPVAVNQGFIVMQPNPSFPTEFAYFWTLENLDLIKANANGSTFQEISKKNFRPLKVNHAGENLLEKFLEVVGSLLELIRNNEHENQTLATARDLLLPRLMTGELHLKSTVDAA